MPVCCAYGCNNRTGIRKTFVQKKLEQNTKITFHAIPKDPVRRVEWIKSLKRADWIPSNNSTICSEHFLEEHFDRTSLSCVRLRDHAIPTIFKTSTNSKNESKVSRKPKRKPLGSEGIAASNIYVVQKLDLPSTSFSSDNRVCSKPIESEVTATTKADFRIFDLPSTSFSPVPRMQEISLDEIPVINNIRIIRQKYKRKIRVLQQYKRRQVKKIAYLKTVLNSLKHRKEMQNIHKNISRTNSAILKIQIPKN